MVIQISRSGYEQISFISYLQLWCLQIFRRLKEKLPLNEGIRMRIPRIIVDVQMMMLLTAIIVLTSWASPPTNHPPSNTPNLTFYLFLLEINNYKTINLNLVKLFSLCISWWRKYLHLFVIQFTASDNVNMYKCTTTTMMTLRQMNWFK